MTKIDERDASTICSLWVARAKASADKTAMLVKRDAKYQPVTWSEIRRDANRVAAALVAIGIEPGDRVVLVSKNRYEWIVCDLGIQLARAVNVPVHASLAGAQVAYQIVDSGAKAVIVSGPDQAEKLVDQATRFAKSTRFLSLDPCPKPIGPFSVSLLSDLTAKVDDRKAAEIEQKAVEGVRPDDLMTILYTSGTTGEPKGVMLTQGNLAYNVSAILKMWVPNDDDVRLTWLPLSHIFARTCDFYTWVAAGAVLALADSPEAIIANCQEVHPTLINGVPYFFDKLQRFLVSQGMADKPGTLQAILGGRMRYCGSGGAALADHTHLFFKEQGVFISQGYGLTETSPTISTGQEDDTKVGTVGRLLPGVEVKISDEGEILTRGPHVMRGYWNLPQATAEVIRDGWFLTGDLGELDKDGYLKITGRKKELIVTAAGKNIAPVNLEALLTSDPLIAQVLVIGDARNFLTALVVVNPEPLMAELRELEIPVNSVADALDEPPGPRAVRRTNRPAAGRSVALRTSAEIHADRSAVFARDERIDTDAEIAAEGHRGELRPGNREHVRTGAGGSDGAVEFYVGRITALFHGNIGG